MAKQTYTWNGKQVSAKVRNAALDRLAPKSEPSRCALTADQLMAILERAVAQGLIVTWTATGLDDDGELIEVGILRTEHAEWEYLNRPSATFPFTLKAGMVNTWQES